MENQKLTFIRKVTLWAFCAVQFVVWILLIFVKKIPNPHVLSYAATLFCLAVTLFFCRKQTDWALQAAAFLFTCIADFFLVLLMGEQKTLAMCAFLCAQICYAWRTLLFAKTAKERWLNVVLRLVLSALAAVAVVAVLREKAEPLFVISLVYYANLILSIVFSFAHFKDGIVPKLTAIGLLCFSLCDITIGFDFLINIFSLSQGNLIYEIVHLPVSLVTVFYPPSQAILCASAYPFPINQTK